MAIKQLIAGVTATGAGAAVVNSLTTKTYQADGLTTAGAGAATIAVEGSNNGGLTWDSIGTLSLTLSTTSSSDSFTSDDRYSQVRANVSAISGTGASVNVTMGF